MSQMEIHPAIVHFPIALGVVGALAAVVYVFVRREWLRWFAPILLTIALLGAVAAYFSGQSAEDRAEDRNVPEAAIEAHEDSSIWALGLVGLATLLAWATFGKKRGEWVAALIAVLAAAAMLRTSHLGGELVFIHGAGRVAPASGAGAPGVGSEDGAPGDASEAGERSRRGGEHHEDED